MQPPNVNAQIKPMLVNEIQEGYRLNQNSHAELVNFFCNVDAVMLKPWKNKERDLIPLLNTFFSINNFPEMTAQELYELYMSMGTNNNERNDRFYSRLLIPPFPNHTGMDDPFSLGFKHHFRYRLLFTFVTQYALEKHWSDTCQVSYEHAIQISPWISSNKEIPSDIMFCILSFLKTDRRPHNNQHSSNNTDNSHRLFSMPIDYIKQDVLIDINNIMDTLSISLDDDARWRYFKKNQSLFIESSDQANLRNLYNSLHHYGSSENLDCQHGKVSNKHGYFGIQIVKPTQGQLLFILNNINQDTHSDHPSAFR